MPGTRPQTECADGRVRASAGSLSGFESQLQNFGDADLCAVGKLDLYVAVEAPAVEPGAVAALVHDGKSAARQIAPQAQVLARNLVGGVERQVHPKVLAAAPDTHFVLRDEVSLRAGIVLVTNFAENFFGHAPRAFPVAGYARDRKSVV